MALDENSLSLLKLNLQEKLNDSFTDEDLNMLLTTHEDVWLASYHGCCIKATLNSSIELPGGLKMESSSEYWMKLADMYLQRYMRGQSTESTESSDSDIVVNSAGYKNSMSRVDEF